MAAPTGVEHAPLSVLKSNPRNARIHCQRQIRQIADSINEFGFNNPILVDEDMMILAGHGRCEAARLLNKESVPVLRIEHLSPSQKRAYILAENQLATLAGWDNEILALELQDLADLDPEFDLTLTGFDMGEIDVLIEDLVEDDEPEPPVPEVAEGPAITQLGDIWLVGQHRLICGDATDLTTYQRLLGEAPAQMVFTDPPYNVPINGHVCGLGGVKHREFAMASGEMSEDAFQAFLAKVFRHFAACCQDGAIHYVCMDWRHM
ncbi:MAG: ParB N-terminal domain-containing protein, partial [Hyphomicrobiaceae bacterium]